MNLPHQWIATWYESQRRVMLTKPSRMQPITLAWEPPFLKSIDPISGMPAFGLTAAIPEDVRTPLLEEARRRWG